MVSQLFGDSPERENQKQLVGELRTRGYELDREALIPPHIFLRFMEQLRWEVNESAVSALPRLFEDGNFAVVVAQRLVVREAIGFNVDLIGTTCVAHVGRTSLDFFHSLTRAGEKEPFAGGLVTGVFMSPEGRPTPLPDEIRSLARPGCKADFDFAEPLRAEPPTDAFEYRTTVRPSDLDLLRHVNHANYLAFCEDARLRAAEAGAFGEVSERASGRIRAAAIEYKQQAVAGDELVAQTWVVSDDPLEIGVLLRRAGEPEVVTNTRLRL